jgi:hypothetical protein
MSEENKVEVVEENVKEKNDESTALTVQPVKVKKHIEAKKLVDEAKSIVEASDNEMEDCKILLEDDLRDYDVAKKALKSGGFNAAKALLVELGVSDDAPDESDDNGVDFEANDNLKPIVLKNVHSGRFTGLLLSLLGGLVTLGGLIYWATEKLDMTLYLDNVPSNESMQSIFGWFGTQIGRPDDAANGGILVGLVVLVVMALIYALRVWLRGGKNLRFASEQMKETQKYITHKSNCKLEMDRVDAHITDAIKVLKDHEVVLFEQVGKLKRVLHFEGQKSGVSAYSTKSSEMMKETEMLIENISRFMSTSMSEEGKLSGKSTLFLHAAKETLEKVLAKLA